MRTRDSSNGQTCCCMAAVGHQHTSNCPCTAPGGTAVAQPYASTTCTATAGGTHSRSSGGSCRCSNATISSSSSSACACARSSRRCALILATLTAVLQALVVGHLPCAAADSWWPWKAGAGGARARAAIPPAAPPPPPPGAVTFASGSGGIAYNPAGNVSWLLSYDPLAAALAPPVHAPPAAARTNTSARTYPLGVLLPDNATAANDTRPPPDAQLAVRELLLPDDPAKKLPYDPMQPHKLPPREWDDSDFVFATGSFPDRYLLAQSTRAWRRGIRAFFAVNNTRDVEALNAHNAAYKERYEYFPDDCEGDLGRLRHGTMRGDTRAAIAPFLAHEHFGETYKWMLYGDDDTVFYLPALKRLLAHYDPELPHIISDNLWYRSKHPNPFAPRCLPCHLAVDADPAPPPPAPPGAGEAASAAEEQRPRRPVRIPTLAQVVQGYSRALVGARVSADLKGNAAVLRRMRGSRVWRDFNASLARLDAAGVDPNASIPGLRYLPRPACPFCTAHAACSPPPPPAAHASCHMSGGHGGAGIVFSVGLLRRLSSARMKACYMRIFNAPGGDSMLSGCLWEAGYAYTDPGSSTLAAYDGNYVMFASEAAKWVLHDPLTVMLRGKCDARCRWALRNSVSHHGRGRHFQSFEQSAAYLYATTASYSAAHKWMAFMAERDKDIAALAEVAAAASGGGGGAGSAARAAVREDSASESSEERARQEEDEQQDEGDRDEEAGKGRGGADEESDEGDGETEREEQEGDAKEEARGRSREAARRKTVRGRRRLLLANGERDAVEGRWAAEAGSQVGLQGSQDRERGFFDGALLG